MIFNLVPLAKNRIYSIKQLKIYNSQSTNVDTTTLMSIYTDNECKWFFFTNNLYVLIFFVLVILVGNKQLQTLPLDILQVIW